MFDYRNIKVTVAIPFRWFMKSTHNEKPPRQVGSNVTKWDPRMIYYDSADMNALSKVFSLEQVVEQIKTNPVAQRRCNVIRNTPDLPEKEGKHIKITGLNRLYWGEFNLTNGRFVDDDIKYHPGVMCFDVDGFDISKAYLLKQLLADDPHVILAFVSPRAVGVKFLVATPTDLTEHKFRYAGIKKYYEKLLGVVLDSSCRNPARTCFLSYDPNPYINWNADVCLEYDTTELEKALTPRMSQEEKDKKYGEETPEHKLSCAVKRIEDAGKRWSDGERHEYLLTLAGTCKGFDMDEDDFRRVAYGYLNGNTEQTTHRDQVVKSVFRN